MISLKENKIIMGWNMNSIRKRHNRLRSRNQKAMCAYSRPHNLKDLLQSATPKETNEHKASSNSWKEVSNYLPDTRWPLFWWHDQKLKERANNNCCILVGDAHYIMTKNFPNREIIFRGSAEWIDYYHHYVLFLPKYLCVITGNDIEE